MSKQYILIEDTLFTSGPFGYGLFDIGLDLQKQYIFEGIKKHVKVTLVVSRINYSTLKYDITVLKSGVSHVFSGLAHGGVSILGSESDTDTNSGISYFCSEYSNKWKDSSVMIRIDSEQSKRATVIIRDKLILSLDSCPTLQRKE